MLRIPHYYTGIGFIFIAFWHLFHSIQAYFRSLQKQGEPFKVKVYYKTRICGRLVALESWMKLIFTIVAFFWEFSIIDPTSYGEMKLNKDVVKHSRFQHMCMFATFAIAAAFEILDHNKFRLPNNFLYPIYTFAFSSEAVLFYWHYPDTGKPLIREIHMLQLLIVIATLFIGYIELMFPTEILPQLCRIFLLLFQGLWFCVIDSIAHPLPGSLVWDPKNPFDMMDAAILYVGVAIICIFIIMAVWFLTAFRYGMLRYDQKSVALGSYKLLADEELDNTRLLVNN